jgi:hypothetical protein
MSRLDEQELLNIVADEIGTKDSPLHHLPSDGIHVSYRVRRDKQGARLSCGCCGRPNYKDMEFHDHSALVAYACLLNTIIMMLGIAVPTKDALTFCFNATPSLHAAFDIVEKTMNVKRKSLVRRNYNTGTISLTAPAEFRGTFLLLVNRVGAFRAELLTDDDLWARYVAMLKELAAVIKDEIIPFRQGKRALPAVVTPVSGRKRQVDDFDFSGLSPDSSLSKSLRGGVETLNEFIDNYDFFTQRDNDLFNDVLMDAFQDDSF